MNKRVLSLLLALTMVLSLVPAFKISAWAEQPAVSYRSPVYRTPGTPSSGIDHWETLSCDTYTLITSQSELNHLNTGWYVVRGDVSIDTKSGLGESWNITGDVKLILEDGCNLTLKGVTIFVNGTNSLTIYGGSTNNVNSGKLNVSGRWQSAGIGGIDTSGANQPGANITINGGIVNATGGGGNSAGIGGSTWSKGSGSNIIINDGIVTATGCGGGAGIGGGQGSTSNLYFNGGRVFATGGRAVKGVGAISDVYVSSDVSVISKDNTDAKNLIKHNQGEDISSSISQYNKLEFFVHKHTWNNISKENNIISATCIDSSYRHVGSETITLGITGIDSQFTDSPVEAQIDGKDVWEANGLEIEVSYVGRDGTVYAESTTAPTNIGKYTATAVTKVPTGGQSYSVSADFEILKRSWDTLPVVSVKGFNYGAYDDTVEANLPTNDIGIKTDIKYYFNTENSNEGGTEWTKEAVNQLDSGTYYVYAVLTENENMYGCTTEASPFTISHVHEYSYQKLAANSITVECTSLDKSCPGDTKTITLKIEDAVYTGKPYVPTGVSLFEKESGATVCVTYKDSNNTEISAPTNVGNYKAELTIPDKTLYGTSNPVTATADFKIVAKPVEKPTVGTKTYTYNGSAQTYVLTDSADKEFYKISDATATQTNAGTYDVVVELKDTNNSIWVGNTTEPLTFTDAFTIDPKKIDIPLSTTAYDYDGGYQIYGYEDGSVNYYTSSPYSVSNFYRVDAGSQNVVFSLKDKVNTCWSDGTTTDKSRVLKVNPLEVPKPVADPRSFYADGSTKAYYPFYLVGDNYYCFEGLFYNTTGNQKSAAGNYKVSVSPAANLAWEGGSTNPLTFDFKIAAPNAYASIYCLKEKATGEYTDGYVYGSYLYDDENPANEYVATHYEPYISYKYPSNATCEFFYTHNPNNKDFKYKWKDLKYTQIRFSGEYTVYYIYARVTANGYQTYTTSVCPVYIYKANQSVTSAKKRTYQVEETYQKNIGSAKRPIYVPKKQTVTKTENKAIKGRSFNSIALAGAAMIKDLQSGFDVTQWTAIYDKKSASFVPSQISSIQSCYLGFSSVMASNTRYLSGSAEKTLNQLIQEGTLPMEKIIADYKGETISDKYQLIGDSIGYPANIVKANGNPSTTLLNVTYSNEVYTVTFDNLIEDENGSTVYMTQSVKAGDIVVTPTAPTADGLVFKGWYTASDVEENQVVTPTNDGRLWDFDDYTVSGDMTLYARWEVATTGGDGSASSTISASVSGDQTSVKVDATVSGTTATVKTISAADIDKIGTKSNVVIDLSSSEKAINVAVLTKDTVKAISNSDASGLEIKVSNGSVTFDQKTLDGIVIGMKGTDLALTVNAESAAEKTLTAEQKSAVKDLKNSLVIDAFLSSSGHKISEFDGTVTVTVAVPADLTGDVTVYYLDEKGALTEIKSEIVTIDGKRYTKFATNHFSHYVIESDGEAWKGFSDVAKAAYYYDAVKWAAMNGITSGVDATHFAPNAITTRGQMVTFLWRAAGSPEPTTTTCAFTDLKVDEFYYKAVLWAVENGLTKGVSATEFAPDVTVDRAQSVTFLARYEGVKDDATGYAHGFSDVAAADYFNNAVAWAATNKVTDGTSETTFEPYNDCLRAQIVTFIYRNFAK